MQVQITGDPAPAPAAVWLETSTASVNPGDEFQVDIYVADVASLYGASLDLVFDSSLVEVLPLAVGEERVVQPGSFIVDNGFQNPVNRINIGAAAGWDVLEYALTLVGDISGINTSPAGEKIGTVSFLALQPGTIDFLFDLDFNQAKVLPGPGKTLLCKLSNSESNFIVYAAQDMQVTIEGEPQTQPNILLDNDFIPLGYTGPIFIYDNTPDTGLWTAGDTDLSVLVVDGTQPEEEPGYVPDVNVNIINVTDNTIEIEIDTVLEPGNYGFFVNKGQQTIGAVGFMVVYEPGEYRQVTGKILDQDGNPLAGAEIAVQSLYDNYLTCYGFTNHGSSGMPGELQEGEFELYIPDGKYRIDYIKIMDPFDQVTMEGTDGGFYHTDVTFTVDEGIVGEITGASNFNSIQLPAPNAEIHVKKGTQLLPGFLDFQKEQQDIGPMWLGMSSGTGKFFSHLKPGTYTFMSFCRQNGEYVQLNQTITIGAESDFTGENAIILGFVSEDNVIIRFENELSGEPLQNVGVSIEGINNYTYRWINTETDGLAHLKLEPGAYRISGYDLNARWYQFDYRFDVTAGHTTASPLEITVRVKGPNVSGQILYGKDGGQVPLQWGWASCRKLAAEPGEYEEYFGFETNSEGRFSLTLEDGDYLVESAGNWQHWEELNFAFRLEAGEIYVGTNIIEGDLNVARKPDNVQGKVYKVFVDDNDENTNELYASNTYLNMALEFARAGVSKEQIQAEPWRYLTWVNVKEDGTFSVNLKEGVSYRLWSIMMPERFIEVPADYLTFTAGVDSDNLIITPPRPNFSGAARDFDGNPLEYGWFHVEKADFTEWHWVPLEGGGSFGRMLQEGGEYIVRDIVYYNAEDWNIEGGYAEEGATEQRIVLDKKIVVDKNVNYLLQPNVKGILQGITSADLGLNDSGSDPAGMNYFWASAFIRPDKADVPEADWDNLWKYEKNVSLQIIGSGAEETVVFYACLNAGEPGLGKNYWLEGISSPAGWINTRAPFTIGDDDPQTGQYEKTINLAANVTGNISEADGSPVAGAWIDFKEIPDVTDPLMYESWFGTSTDNEGKFKLKLEPGTYQLNGYHIQGYEEAAGIWMPGKWVEVNYKFKVNASGELTDMQDNPLQGLNISPNVSGYVRKYFSEEDNPQDFLEDSPAAGDPVTARNAWAAIKPAGEDFAVDKHNWEDVIWTNSGYDGLFSLMLPPGKYQVVEAGGMGFWMPVKINFEIDADNNIIPENPVYLENGKLVIKPETPNVQGRVFRSYTDDTANQPLEWGWLAIKPAHYPDWQWDENVRWVEIKNGAFAFSLPDGQWKVFEVNGNNYWHRYDAKFSVVGGELALDSPWVVNERLLLYPPAHNFIGEVQNKDGIKVVQNLWITVKPSDAAENEWEKFFGFEAANGVFSTHIKPGSYRIVEVGGPYFWLKADIPFTIGNDFSVTIDDYYRDGDRVIIREKPPNVNVEVYGKLGGTDRLLRYGWAAVARFDADGKQLRMNGEAITLPVWERAGDIWWRFTHWYPVNENGRLEVKLDPNGAGGFYRVINVNGEVSDGESFAWVGYEPKLEFVAGEGASTLKADGSAFEEIREPGPNVVINIKGVAEVADYAWLDVLHVKPDGSRVYVYVPFVQRDDVSGDYIFSAYLENGEYRVRSFSTNNYYRDIREGRTVAGPNNNFEFDLADDVFVNVSGSIAGGSPQYQATIRKVDNTGDNPILMAGDENMRTVRLNADGSFSFMLKDGETWAVVSVNTPQGYRVVTSQLQNTLYTVDAGELSPPQWQDISIVQ
ncbi:cohesin domain-containing protein [Candidatus Micrarchaeota archaeon]|nr:cohesin domain-containing protein [Candidatus Micrarchaeota archaeon]